MAFSIFAAVKLTQSPAEPLQPAAAVSISRASIPAERPKSSPKPKVIAESSELAITKAFQPGLTANIQTVSRADKQNFQQAKPVTEEDSPEEKATINAQVEFFKSAAEGRRICYVVDCSGSMQGLWGRVKAELFESIGRLQPDQYFSVIVFGAGAVLESGGGLLVRATEGAKKDAYDFIASVQPRGTTNALAALEYAIKIQDRSGQPASVIYFLTDGFELNKQDNARFAHQVETLRKGFAPQARIDTIGFWPDERDRKLLETIARQSGGQITLVGEKDER